MRADFELHMVEHYTIVFMIIALLLLWYILEQKRLTAAVSRTVFGKVWENISKSVLVDAKFDKLQGSKLSASWSPSTLKSSAKQMDTYHHELDHTLV